MLIQFKDIKIPHLGYTIKVRDIRKNPKKNFVMYVEKLNSNTCQMNLKRKIADTDFPTLAHETLHVLQYIADARNIDLTYEQENVGYLMQYILNQLLGFSYKDGN